MQNSMNKFAWASFEDADILLMVTDIFEKYTGEEKVIKALAETTVPKFLIINKTDLDKSNMADEVDSFWEQHVKFDEVFFISAQEKINTEYLFEKSWPSFPKHHLTTPKMKFQISQNDFCIRNDQRKILLLYKQEVPYSCEVLVTRFKEEEKMVSLF